MARLLKGEERRKAFEARWKEIKERGMRALDEGTFEGPIVPIGFKPPEARRRPARLEATAAEEVSFLRLKVEQPEEPPRVSEGGPSGSGGPAPEKVEPEQPEEPEKPCSEKVEQPEQPCPEKVEQPEEPPRVPEGGPSGSGGPAPAEVAAEEPAEPPPLPPPLRGLLPRVRQ